MLRQLSFWLVLILVAARCFELLLDVECAMGPNETDKIRQGRKTWEECAAQGNERPQKFMTVSSVPIKALYATEDIENLAYLEELSYPGYYPYTRGIQPNTYRGRQWTMRQFAGFATAVESNELYKYLLNQGQTGLSVAFDMPTIMGYDSDHPRALGEFGRVGVAIDSLADMERLFAEIPPEPSLRLITDTFAFADRHLAKWNTISISGYLRL